MFFIFLTLNTSLSSTIDYPSAVHESIDWSELKWTIRNEFLSTAESLFANSSTFLATSVGLGSGCGNVNIFLTILIHGLNDKLILEINTKNQAVSKLSIKHSIWPKRARSMEWSLPYLTLSCTRLKLESSIFYVS